MSTAEDSTVDEDGPECPLCLEPLDATDRNFKPCRCGYQVCLWCWHSIKEKLRGRCPACRQPYEDENIVFTAPDPEEIARQMKRTDRKTKKRPTTGASTGAVSGSATFDRAVLADVRVLQRNLCYVVGLPGSVAKEDTLRRREYFGKFGRIVKVAVNRKPVHSAGVPSYSAYVTFKHAKDAEDAIRAVHGTEMEGRLIRATYGTTKYCSNFMRRLPCNNPNCLYLHDLANPDDCYTKEDLIASDRFTFPSGMFDGPDGKQASNSNTSPTDDIDAAESQGGYPSEHPLSVQTQRSYADTTVTGNTPVKSPKAAPSPYLQAVTSPSHRGHTQSHGVSVHSLPNNNAQPLLPQHSQSQPPPQSHPGAGSQPQSSPRSLLHEQQQRRLSQGHLTALSSMSALGVAGTNETMEQEEKERLSSLSLGGENTILSQMVAKSPSPPPGFARVAHPDALQPIPWGMNTNSDGSSHTQPKNPGLPPGLLAFARAFGYWDQRGVPAAVQPETQPSRMKAGPARSRYAFAADTEQKSGDVKPIATVPAYSLFGELRAESVPMSGSDQQAQMAHHADAFLSSAAAVPLNPTTASVMAVPVSSSEVQSSLFTSSPYTEPASSAQLSATQSRTQSRPPGFPTSNGVAPRDLGSQQDTQQLTQQTQQTQQDDHDRNNADQEDYDDDDDDDDDDGGSSYGSKRTSRSNGSDTPLRKGKTRGRRGRRGGGSRKKDDVSTRGSATPKDAPSNGAVAPGVKASNRRQNRVGVTKGVWNANGH